MVGVIPVPSQCGYECSLVMPAFLQECKYVIDGAFRTTANASAVHELRSTSGTCLRRDHQQLLDILYELGHGQGCTLDLSKVRMLGPGAPPPTLARAHRRALRQGQADDDDVKGGDSETCKVCAHTGARDDCTRVCSDESIRPSYNLMSRHGVS